MYKIKFGKKALEEWGKFEQNLKKRIWNKLQSCKENPFHFLEHLEDIEGYKLRIGDYRAIVDINKSFNIIWVLKVGHRKNVYEN